MTTFTFGLLVCDDDGSFHSYIDHGHNDLVQPRPIPMLGRRTKVFGDFQGGLPCLPHLTGDSHHDTLGITRFHADLIALQAELPLLSVRLKEGHAAEVVTQLLQENALKRERGKW